MRVIVVDSDERRAYEEAMRVKSMERTREALEKLQRRVAAGKLSNPRRSPRPSGCCSGATATATPPGRSIRGASGTSRTRQAWGARRGSRVNM